MSNILKIKFDNIVFVATASILSLIMLNGIDNTSSDFSVYLKILQNKTFANMKSSEPLSLLIFKFMSLFDNKKLALSIFSIFIYSSVIYLLRNIGFQYIQKSQYIDIMLIIAIGFSFPVLSLSQSILRQGLAIVVILYFLGSAKPLSLFSRLLLFLLVVLIHNAMAVFLPLVFVKQDINTNKQNLFIFSLLSIIYIYFVKELLIEDIKKYADLSSINFSISYFIISITSLFMLSLNNFRNSWLPFLYLNSLIVILVNHNLINVDRFLYLPWIFAPILMFKFLNNNVLIGLFTILWVGINFIYQPTRFY